MSSSHIHLAAILEHAPSPHVIGTWRSPRSWRGFRFDRPEVWEHIARTLERGRFDMAFFADGFDLHDTWRDSPDATLRHAIQYPKHDPLPLLPIMARVTDRLGLASTQTTTYLPPYYVARTWATLDHLTKGRAAWNVVTSYGRNEAANFGFDQVLDHDERYDRADEFMEVCYKLWNSWEPDAILMDRESGVFADPEKVHRIDHEGPYFKCRGPLQVPRSPQGRPVLIQAGSSPRGMRFASQHADVVFAVRDNVEAMKRQRQQFVRAFENQGRDPSELRVLWGAVVVVAETESEARRKHDAIYENIDWEAGLALMSGHFNYDLSTLPLDAPLSEFEAEGVRGLVEMVMQDYGPDVTLREAGERYGAGHGPRFVGTPSQVADQMESAIDEVGGDGFMLVSWAIPATIDDFVDLVTPELQRRGRLRADYSGRTLTEHLKER